MYYFSRPNAFVNILKISERVITCMCVFVVCTYFIKGGRERESEGDGNYCQVMKLTRIALFPHETHVFIVTKFTQFLKNYYCY